MRAAHEDLPAAGRVARTCRAVRARNRHSADAFEEGLVPGPVEHTFRLHGVFHECRRHEVRSRRHRYANLEVVVADLALPTHHEQLDAAAIQTNIQLALLRHADDRRRVLPTLKTNLDDVLGVERKMMADGNATPGADREVAAFTFGLHG